VTSLVQVGARASRSDRTLWDDPIWWRGSIGYGRMSPWHGPYWGVSAGFPANPRYDREVAILLRDRASGKPLFEARASNEGGTGLDRATLGATRAALSSTSAPAEVPPALQPGPRNERRSSSQPFRRSRAALRCEGVVALWICAMKAQL
jgi:hypothetical protein